MKPYLSVSHAYISKLRPVIGFLEQYHIYEASNRIRPTSHLLYNQIYYNGRSFIGEKTIVV